jgi:hypothetical protein
VKSELIVDAEDTLPTPASGTTTFNCDAAIHLVIDEGALAGYATHDVGVLALLFQQRVCVFLP